MRRFLLFILLLYGLPPAIQAQKEFHFDNYSTAQGMSSNEVRSILRDSRGLVWVGTGSGLNRFDGHQFDVFRSDDGRSNTIGGNVIGAMAEDNQGRLWIGHNNGLDLYDPRCDSFRHFHFYLSDKQELLFDRNGSMVMVGDDHLFICNSFSEAILLHTKTYQYYRTKVPDVEVEQRPVQYRARPENTILHARRKSDHELWLSTGFGIFSYNIHDTSYTYYPIRNGKLNYPPGPILFDPDRELLWFACFGSGLYAFAYKRGTLKNWPEVEAISYVVSTQDLAFKSHRELWTTGFGYFNMDSGKYYPIRHVPDDIYSIPSQSTTAFHKDKEGYLWIGTTSGLSKLDPGMQAFRHVLVDAHPVYEYDNSIFEVYEEPADKKLYITSFYKEGLYVYDPVTQKSEAILLANGRPLIGTTRIFRDSRGITWLLSKDQVYQVDLSKRQFRPIPMPSPPGGASGNVIDIAEDAEGNLWMTHFRAGLLYWDRKKEALRYINCEEDGICPRRCYFLATSFDKKTIWAGGIGEPLISFDVRTRKGQVFKTFPAGKRAFQVHNITGLATDRLGCLWIGSGEGLARLTPDLQCTIIDYRDGLSSTTIEGIRAGPDGTLWLATIDGISRIDPLTRKISNFSAKHGLKIDATLDNFSFSPSGEVFSGTKRGFIRFHPDSIRTNQQPPQLVLTRLLVNGVEKRGLAPALDFLDHLYLGPDESFFTLEYSGISHTLPEDVRYAYILDGFERNWVEVGSSRQAAFTNVPPGTYTFRLKACNNDGIWTTEEKTLKITVGAPFWQRGWFVAIVALLMAGAGYGAYRYRIMQIRKEAQMKNEFNKKLAEVEMTALRSQMNPHFLFNCLNSINRFIQRNEPDAASAYLSKFSRLIRLVLDNSRSNTVPLSDELEALRLYVELEAMRFTDRFEYRFELSPELETTGLDIPPMLIQPYVENAIWHGLMQREDSGGILTIRAYPSGKQLVIEVEDNGIGRAAASTLKSKSATSHKSHGMKVTSERIALINEVYQSEAHLEIIDLQHPDGSPAGTRVVLRLPLD